MRRLSLLPGVLRLHRRHDRGRDTEPTTRRTGGWSVRITFEIPIKTKGWSNNREHWRAADKRKSAEKTATNIAATPHLALLRGRIPSSVTLTRKYVSWPMDSDNLPISQKYVRDSIAKFLCFDDGDERCQWLYKQQKAKRGDFGTLVEVRFYTPDTEDWRWKQWKSVLSRSTAAPAVGL